MKNKAVIIALLAALLLTSDALACSCSGKDEGTLFKQAAGVFLAKVTSTELRNICDPKNKPECTEIIEARFTVTEYFKKPTREIETVRDLSFGFGNCSIGLMSGMSYIFFVSGPDDAIGNYVGMCTGSKPININAKQFEEILAKLRSYGGAR